MFAPYYNAFDYGQRPWKTSGDMSDQEVSLFICGAKCDAGGPGDQGGHIWDRAVAIYDDEGRECGDSLACKCGATAMEFSLWNDP